MSATEDIAARGVAERGVAERGVADARIADGGFADASIADGGVAAEIPGLPRGPDGPVFRAPWEAQAFAIALALHDRGLFTWREWAATLAAEIKRAQAAGDPDTGDTYYHHWLAALERIVAEKGAASRDTLTRCRAAWHRAAGRTPHGTPIALADEDFTAP
jgi:nitrile hydratase accessory protein